MGYVLKDVRRRNSGGLDPTGSECRIAARPSCRDEGDDIVGSREATQNVVAGYDPDHLTVSNRRKSADGVLQ